MAEEVFEDLRARLLGAPDEVRRALGMIAHGSDVVYHPPIGIVGATRTTGDALSPSA
ncbi:MAG: hypothetical protein ACKOC6_01640 [bacterium]